MNINQLFDNLSEEEATELSLVVSTDISNFTITLEEEKEILKLMQSALQNDFPTPSAKSVLEFVLGIPCLETYLKQEMCKLQEYLQENE